MENRMLREIANDDLTPKKHDFQIQKDLHEKIRNDEDYDDWEYGSEPIPLTEFWWINKIDLYYSMPLERLSQGFKDISMTFQINPLNSDLIGLKNENAISRSIRNIVFTLPGEKFFNENFGSRISRTLFETVDDISASIITDEIRNSIQNYEPRVELIDVQSFPDYDNGSFDVTIIYRIIGADVPAQQLQFVLQPTR